LDMSLQVLSDFHKNWNGGNSLVVRNHLALLVDGGGAVIASEPAMYDWGELWVVWGRARAWLDVSWWVLEQFPQELKWRQ
jgi:hypothetical protein